MKQCFSVTANSFSSDMSLLLLRLTAGAAMAIHGWPKIQQPFSWMGPDAFAPGILQALAAVSEFGGGIAWVIGLLTPLASLGILCTMIVAVYLHAVMKGDPFVSLSGGASFELAAIYLVIALVLIFVGPGRHSADCAIFGKKS